MEPTVPFPYRIAFRTHPGRVRSNNEDRAAVVPLPVGARPGVLAVVADGMGGHQAGEVAAQIAVEQIVAAVRSGNPAQPLQTLSTALRQAHEAILAHGRAHPEHAGLGTTCAVVWLQGRRLYLAWIGDSRVYLWQQGRLHRLTTDHTLLEELQAQGGPPLAGLPLAHLLSRHLGSRQHAEPDFRLRLEGFEDDLQALRRQGMRLHAGARLLLCTDGLTDQVTDEEIAQALEQRDLDAALQHLLDLALRRGGRDNITLVGLEIRPGGEGTTGRGRFLEILPWAVLGAGVLLWVLVILLAWRAGLLAW